MSDADKVEITIRIPEGAAAVIDNHANNEKLLGETAEEVASYLLVRAIDDLLRRKP